MYILHIAPFDPSYYPPLINTIHVSATWGFESFVVASSPLKSRSPLGSAGLIASPAPLSRLALHNFLLREGMNVIRKRGRPRLVIGHNLHGLPAATSIARYTSTPLVYHCHDFHSDGSPMAPLLDRVESVCAGLATQVWVPAPERAQIAAARGIGARVHVIRNCPRLVHDLPRKGRLRAWLAANGSRSGGNGKIITRHGRIGPSHLVGEIVEALPLLEPAAEFVVIGEGNSEYIRHCGNRARELGVADRFFVHPYVPHDQLFELLVDGSVASGLYAGDDVNVATPAPNKVYESIALAVPVLVPQGGSLEEDVVRSGAGLAVPLSNIGRDIAPALTQLLSTSEYGRRARELHRARFNYEAQLASTLLPTLRGAPLSEWSLARVDRLLRAVLP